LYKKVLGLRALNNEEEEKSQEEKNRKYILFIINAKISAPLIIS